MNGSTDFHLASVYASLKRFWPWEAGPSWFTAGGVWCRRNGRTWCYSSLVIHLTLLQHLSTPCSGLLCYNSSHPTYCNSGTLVKTNLVKLLIKVPDRGSQCWSQFGQSFGEVHSRFWGLFAVCDELNLMVYILTYKQKGLKQRHTKVLNWCDRSIPIVFNSFSLLVPFVSVFLFVCI